MIGSAFQPQIAVAGKQRPARQVGTLWQEESRVEQSGFTRIVRAGRDVLLDLQKGTPAGAQGNDAGLPRQLGKAQRVAVEFRQRIAVARLQANARYAGGPGCCEG